MITETLETPEVASEVVDRAEITAGNVIVEYSRTEAALAALTAKYAGATYDLTTTAGDKAARAARLELVTLRAALEKKRKVLKAHAIDFGRQVDAKAADLTSRIEALEKPIDDQIKADEARRAAEKAERERIEAERVAKHESNISNIRGYVGLARDLPSARIAKGIASLEAMQFGDEWQEFAERGAEARRETLAALQSLHDKAKAAEEAAAAAEQQRIEQERVAEAQKIEAKRLQDIADDQAAREKEAADRIAAAEAELARKQAAFAADQEAARKAAEAAAVPAEPSAAVPVVVAEVQPEPAAPVPAAALAMPPAASYASVPVRSEPPTYEAAPVKLGEINARIAPFAITADGLRHLGIEPVGRERAAVLYRVTDVQRLCTGVESLVSTLKAPQ